MKLYKFNFLYQNKIECGEMQAHSKYDVEIKILRGYQSATEINIWVI